MYNYIAWIKLSNGTTTEVRIQARDLITAKLLAESMYGASNVINVRTE